MSTNNLLKTTALALVAVSLAACQPADKSHADAKQETKPVASATADKPTQASEPNKTVDESKPSDASASESIRVAQPKLVVETLDGGTFDLTKQRGQFTVVNFWATWCTPCLEEMPDLDDLHARRSDITVIGLAFEETTKEALETFLTEHAVSYPIAMIDPFEPPADFDTPRGLPMTYVINPEGVVIKKIIGPVTAHELEAVVDGGGDHEQSES